MKRTLAVTASVAALAGGALLATGVAGPATADPVLSPDLGGDVSTGATRVVLRVEGCGRDCTVQLSSYQRDGDRTSVWSSRLAPVRDGRAVFRVEPEQTVGMSIAVRAPWERFTGAVSHVVLRYDERPPGTRVTERAALRAQEGDVCFRGTNGDRLVLPVTVFRSKSEDVRRGVGAAAFTTTTQPTVGTSERTIGGYYGSQDVPCAPSS